jgi:hypothetical protein
MPFVLIVAGVVLLIAAVRGPSCGTVPCHQLLFYLLAEDFTGPNNFIFWFLSIIVIGAIGYIPKLKPISDGFLVLVIVSLFVRKNSQGQSFIIAFENQIASTQSAKPAVTTGTQTGLPTQSYFINSGFGGPTVSIGSGGINIGGSVGVGLPGGGGVSVGPGGVIIGGPGGTIGVGLPPIGSTGPGGYDPWGGGFDFGGQGPFGGGYPYAS